MLVDNSIVVIENIYRLRHEGYSASRAAIEGARQVSGAIFASTLTTICVFLPIVFTEGLSRQLFTDMGLTIAYSLIASLIIALTLVPAMGATALRTVKEKEHHWFDIVNHGYEKLLRCRTAPQGHSSGSGDWPSCVQYFWSCNCHGNGFYVRHGFAADERYMTMPQGSGKEETL
jgi:HAE1 family hydrophobic/amphiphilic exporter-1